MGSTVSLRYRVLLEDGTVAESNFDEEQPLSLRLGDGTLPEALEFCLLGLRPGQRDRRQLRAEQAWGARDPDNRQRIPLASFPAAVEPAPGQVVAFALPGGEETMGTVLAVTDGYAEVDFNHPLAGHTVLFEVEIVDAAPP